MSNSGRGPLSGVGAPFVMHLERVCRLIDMGAAFVVEFHPNGDNGEGMISGLKLRILEGGEVALMTMDGTQVTCFDLALANYKRVWRCWQNGIPTLEQRRTALWG